MGRTFRNRVVALRTAVTCWRANLNPGSTGYDTDYILNSGTASRTGCRFGYDAGQGLFPGQSPDLLLPSPSDFGITPSVAPFRVLGSSASGRPEQELQMALTTN